MSSPSPDSNNISYPHFSSSVPTTSHSKTTWGGRGNNSRSIAILPSPRFTPSSTYEPSSPPARSAKHNNNHNSTTLPSPLSRITSGEILSTSPTIAIPARQPNVIDVIATPPRHMLNSMSGGDAFSDARKSGSKYTPPARISSRKEKFNSRR